MVLVRGGPLGIMQSCMDLVVPYIHDRKHLSHLLVSFNWFRARVAETYVYPDEMRQEPTVLTQ